MNIKQTGSMEDRFYSLESPDTLLSTCSTTTPPSWLLPQLNNAYELYHASGVFYQDRSYPLTAQSPTSVDDVSTDIPAPSFASSMYMLIYEPLTPITPAAETVQLQNA